MPYYAPFYRPTYQQEFAQGQYMQPPQIPSNPSAGDFLWVLNENEATSYPVAPNNTVILWDKNIPVVYVKSVNMQGIPSMRILDYTERVNQPAGQANVQSQQGTSAYATLEQFNALRDEFEAMRKRFEEPKTKSKKTEVENNG